MGRPLAPLPRKTLKNKERRLLLLKEWQATTAELSSTELSDLQGCGADLVVQPKGAGTYSIQPTSIVGAINTPDLRVVIKPKFEIDRLFHLLGRSRGVTFLRDASQLSEYKD